MALDRHDNFIFLFPKTRVPPHHIERPVLRHLRQPGCGIRREFSVGPLPERLEKCFLERVLGQLEITQAKGAGQRRDIRRSTRTIRRTR